MNEFPPIVKEEENFYEDVDYGIQKFGIKLVRDHLRAARLYQLVRWAGATAQPIKPEAKKTIHAAPHILEVTERWRREGEFLGNSVNRLGRYYFAKRFAVTPYAIPEVD